MMRLVVLTVGLLLAGCCGISVDQRVVDGVVYGPDRRLVPAIYAYRAGSGSWPSSAQALGKVVNTTLGLDRYENLRFEPVQDGSLSLSFDRYVSPDGTMTWTHYGISLAIPPAN